MPEFIKLTPTRIETFERCPRRFELAYVCPVGPRPVQSSPHLSFGKSMHECLYRFHRGGAHRAYDLAAMMKLLEESWRSRGYASEEEQTAYWSEAVRICESYYASSQGEEETHLAHELFLGKRLTVDGIDVRISGKIDRLSVRADGLLEVVDYKTSREAPSCPDLLSDSSAPFVYYLLAKTGFPEYKRVAVSYLYLRKQSRLTIDYADGLGPAAKARFKEIVRQISDGPFPPRSGAHCGWCEFREDCPSYCQEAQDIDELI